MGELMLDDGVAHGQKNQSAFRFRKWRERDLHHPVA